MGAKKILLRSLLALLSVVVLLVGASMLLIYIYRNEIKVSIADKVREQFGLELRIEKVQISLFSSWPNAAILLKNVELSSNLYKGPKENFLRAGAVYVSFNLRKLIHKQLSIKQVSLRNARIFLRKKADGSLNYEIKKQVRDSSQAKSNFILEMDKVTIRNTEFNFVNEQRKQHFALNLVNLNLLFKARHQGFLATMDAEVQVGGLIFKSNKGAFFRNTRLKLKLELMNNKQTKQLCVLPPSDVEIENRLYRLACLFKYGEEKNLYLWAESENAELSRVTKVLGPKIQRVLNNFHVSKPLKANMLLGLALGQGREPILILNAVSVNNYMTIGFSKIPYSNLSFKARIVSITSDKKYGDGDKAQITFEPVSGNVYEFPFTARVKVLGFRNTKIKIGAGVKIEGERIHFDFAKRINMKGECMAKIKYEGPANKLNKNEFLSKAMDLKAELWFTNFYFQPKDNFYFFKLNGSASLNRESLLFNKLQVSTNGGNLTVNGSAGNFINYVLGIKPGLQARLNVNSEQFDIGHYLRKNPTSKSSRGLLPNPKSRPSLMADEKFEVNLNFQANYFEINKIKGHKARILADYKKKVLYLNSIQMEICHGQLSATGRLDNWKRLSSDIDIKNMNVSELFGEMDNFGQQSVKAENISGRLNLKANFNATLDDQKQMIAPSIRSEVKLKLTDGHLINFEPMQNVGRYVFRNRDFKDITFSEINESFFLKGQAMKIEEMELASSVMNMFISGVYNFKESSCINLLIPWSNLRHRGKDYVAKPSGENADEAKGLRLNFTGLPGKMKMGVGYCTLKF